VTDKVGGFVGGALGSTDKVGGSEGAALGAADKVGATLLDALVGGIDKVGNTVGAALGTADTVGTPVGAALGATDHVGAAVVLKSNGSANDGLSLGMENTDGALVGPILMPVVDASKASTNSVMDASSS
jgi:hypothetical protein